MLFSLDNAPFLQGLGAFFTARWSMAAMGSTTSSFILCRGKDKLMPSWLTNGRLRPLKRYKFIKCLEDAISYIDTQWDWIGK